METVFVSAILWPEARTAEGRDAAIGAAARLGFALVSKREATLTLSLPLAAFEALFGHAPGRTPARRGAGDTHMPPAFAPEELPVPSALAAWVEAAGVEGPAVRLARGVYH